MHGFHKFAETIDRSQVSAFVRAIMSNWQDYLPRMVFADWLEEQGVCSESAHMLRDPNAQIVLRSFRRGGTPAGMQDVHFAGGRMMRPQRIDLTGNVWDDNAAVMPFNETIESLIRYKVRPADRYTGVIHDEPVDLPELVTKWEWWDNDPETVVQTVCTLSKPGNEPLPGLYHCLIYHCLATARSEKAMSRPISFRAAL